MESKERQPPSTLFSTNTADEKEGRPGSVNNDLEGMMIKTKGK